MTAPWTPLRWPSVWKDPAALDLIRGTAIDYLLIDKGGELEAVRERAKRDGLHIAEPDAPPSGVTVVKGQWPGIRSRMGAGRVSAGPTGGPWIDSNGWLIRLTAALQPETAVWVDAAPPANLRGGAPYLLSVADAGSFGGRWIITLDPNLAGGIAAQRADALEAWKGIASAAKFFADHKDWAALPSVAMVGVVSDFSGPNEFFSRELLNLIARGGQHVRIFPKASLAPNALNGLRAVVYPDAQPPSAALRKRILDFVTAGGMLIASPQWGAVPGQAAAPDDEGPRFSVRSLGKGRVALAKAGSANPAEWAQDCVVLVSHRYDLVRFWNGGSTASFVAGAPDGRRAVAHLLFYANRGPDAASVRIAGPYRSAKALTMDGPVDKIESVNQQDAIEVHLPQVPPYVALELEV